MRNILFFLVFYLSAAAANAREFALLDTSILGKSIARPVVMLSPHSAAAIKPIRISLDTSADMYSAATLHFRDVEFKEMLDELIGLYDKPNFEPSENTDFATWRIVAEKFAVSLSEENDGLKVIYIHFQPHEYSRE